MRLLIVPERQPGPGGDLGLRELAVEAQLQQAALLGRQLRQQLRHAPAIQRGVLRRRRRRLGQRRWIQRLGPAAAQLVDGARARDREHPCDQRAALGVVLMAAAPDLGKDELEDVLGGRAIAQGRRHVSEDRRAVAGVQRVQRTGLAGLQCSGHAPVVGRRGRAPGRAGDIGRGHGRHRGERHLTCPVRPKRPDGCQIAAATATWRGAAQPL